MMTREAATTATTISTSRKFACPMMGQKLQLAQFAISSGIAEAQLKMQLELKATKIMIYVLLKRTNERERETEKEKKLGI